MKVIEILGLISGNRWRLLKYLGLFPEIRGGY
jgi:hypothetical protein